MSVQASFTIINGQVERLVAVGEGKGKVYVRGGNVLSYDGGEISFQKDTGRLVTCLYRFDPMAESISKGEHVKFSGKFAKRRNRKVFVVERRIHGR